MFTAPLRIHIHDNSGHPFQVQLSRVLAAAGHQVLHSYMLGFQTPQGRLSRQAGDSSNLDIRPLNAGDNFPKYSYWRRWFRERACGQTLAEMIGDYCPDIFVASNTPLDMLAVAQRFCWDKQVPFVFWLQDLYAPAIRQIIGPRYCGLGRLIAVHYARKERALLRAANHVIAITEDFRPFLAEAGLSPEQITIVRNWAPLEEMPIVEKQNLWSCAQGLQDKFVLLYSGTLGLKHKPELLLELAMSVKYRPSMVVVVISEGIGADWLHKRKARYQLNQLILLPFQKFDDMPKVLGAADVLLATLEEGAGVFSVPSKILTYLCAGKPIVLACPANNLASRLLQESGAGLVCPPEDAAAFAGTVDSLCSDPAYRAQMGERARAYAESTFKIKTIADKFQDVLYSVVHDIS